MGSLRAGLARFVFGMFLASTAWDSTAFAFISPTSSTAFVPSSISKHGRQSITIFSTNRFQKVFEQVEASDEEGNKDEDEECSIFNLDVCSEEEVAAMASKSQRLPGDENLTGSANFPQYLRGIVTQPVAEVVLVVLVLLSVFVVGVGTLQGLPPNLLEICQWGEVLVSVFFTVEYVVRWYLKDFSPQYVVRPLAIIDLIAILPGIMQVISSMGVDVPSSLLSGALVNLRLLRVLRLQRVLKDYDTFLKFQRAIGLNPSDIRPYQLQLARVVISIFTLLSITAGLVYSTEHVQNPDIPDYFTALYFALTTISTVGYGDISPVTTAGRWAVSASILIGVAVVPAQAAALAESLLNSNTPTRDRKEDNVDHSNGSSSDDDLRKLRVGLKELEKKLDDTNTKLDIVLNRLNQR